MSLPFNKNADPVPVYLARVPETSQNTPFEPQRVRVLENSTAVLYIDNKDREVGGNPFNFRVRFSQTPQNIKRVALVAAEINPIAGNINPKNNVLRVVVVNGPSVGTYTFNLVSGYYATGAAVATMVNVLTAGSAIPALTMTWLPVQQIFTFDFPDDFYIDPTCPFIRFGYNMFGFLPSTNPVENLRSEYASLRFARAIIIRSNTLTQYEKNNSTASNPRLSDPLGVVLTTNLPTEAGSRAILYFAGFPEFRNFEAATQITSADIEILDEWGDSPITYTDSPLGWSIRLIVYTQV